MFLSENPSIVDVILLFLTSIIVDVSIPVQLSKLHSSSCILSSWERSAKFTFTMEHKVEQIIILQQELRNYKTWLKMVEYKCF